MYLPSVTADPHYWNPVTDHGATLIGKMYVTSSGTHTATLDPTWAAGVITGTITNNGLMFIPQDTMNVTFASTQSDTVIITYPPFGAPPVTTYVDYRPFLVITYATTDTLTTIGGPKTIGKSINIGRPK
jgi:hypothetical protein